MNRRTFLQQTTAAFAVAPLVWGQQARPRPSPSQLLWQRDELAMFLHFGVNTFTDREWGDGKEDPAIFAPTRAHPAGLAKRSTDSPCRRPTRDP